MTEQASKKLMSRLEVDETYGLPKRLLEVAAVRGGGPPMVKIGRRVYYRPRDVEAWIESRIVSSTSDETS